MGGVDSPPACISPRDHQHNTRELRHSTAAVLDLRRCCQVRPRSVIRDRHDANVVQRMSEREFFRKARVRPNDVIGAAVSRLSILEPHKAIIIGENRSDAIEIACFKSPLPAIQKTLNVAIDIGGVRDR